MDDKKILEIKDYTKLPSRKIIYSGLTEKKSISYGILAYALDTKRWLVIQRRHSSALLTILSGMYRDSSLNDLVNGLTDEEILLLKNEEYDNISKIDDSFPTDYLKKRFCSNRFKTVLKETKSVCQNDWGWPKGKHEINESLIETALREFNEETKLNPYENTLLILKPISTSFQTGNKIIETKCWILVYHREPKLEKALDNEVEVRDRKWLDEKSTKALLSKEKVSLLDQAIKIIDSW